MYIKSIQVSKPQIISKDWSTAIFKLPVKGPVYLSKLNLEGDQQADLNVHGGVDKAVNVYPIEHYRYWNQRARFLLRKRIRLHKNYYGAFGENFTVAGRTENEICIGDTFAIGNAIVQISQPRKPCWKLSRKFKQAKLPIWVQQTGKTGWYFRVIQEGKITKGDQFNLIQQYCPQWTVAKANELMHSPLRSLSMVEKILECSYLSNSWVKSFNSSLEKNEGTR